MFFFFQAEDGIRDGHVTGVQTCALPIFGRGRELPNVDVDTGTRPSDLDARLAHAAALLDDHVAVTPASADGDVAVPVALVPLHAVPVAQRADAVFPADALGAGGQRKRGRSSHGHRDR